MNLLKLRSLPAIFAALCLIVMPLQAHAEPTANRALKIIATDPVTKQTGEVSLYNKSVAVIIGIDQYVNLSADKQLTYAVRDAQGVADVLKRQYKFDQIITLYNKDATRKNISKLLEVDLPKQLGKEDALFIFWAGHGNQESSSEGDIGYLIPHDGNLDDITTNLTMSEIRDTVSKKIPAKHIFYVMDACYSGLMTETRSVDKAPRRDLAYLQDITKERVRQVLTAGGKNQEVLDGGANGHSVFTGRLIELLEKTGDFITANEIQSIIKEKVNGDARARNHSQTPSFGTLYGSGDFVFIPSLEQKVADNKSEIARLEAEIKQFDVTNAAAKLAAGQALTERQHRDAEITKKAIEGKLKAEQLKQDQLFAEQKRREAESAERQRLLSAKNEDDKRLAKLKADAEARRKSSSAQLTGEFPTVELAVAEIKRLYVRINTIEVGYEKELANTRKQVSQRYAAQLSALDKLQRDEFESAVGFKANQEKQRAELQLHRDAELERLNATAMAAAETVPLRDSIKALAEREYMVGVDSLEAELGQYNANTEQFPISLRSKTQSIKFALNGIIPLQPTEAKTFKQQWVSGLVRLEAKGKPGSDTLTLVLANDADNIRLIFTEGAFLNEKNLTKENSQSLTTYRVASEGGDACYFLIKSWGSWSVSRTGNLSDDSVEKICVNFDRREINLAVYGDGRRQVEDDYRDSYGRHIAYKTVCDDDRKKDGYLLCNSAFFSSSFFSDDGGINNEKLLAAAQSSGLFEMAEKDRQVAIDARRMVALEKMALDQKN